MAERQFVTLSKRIVDRLGRLALDAAARRGGELRLAAFTPAATESNLAGAAGRHALKPRKTAADGG